MTPIYVPLYYILTNTDIGWNFLKWNRGYIDFDILEPLIIYLVTILRRGNHSISNEVSNVHTVHCTANSSPSLRYIPVWSLIKYRSWFIIWWVSFPAKLVLNLSYPQPSTSQECLCCSWFDHLAWYIFSSYIILSKPELGTKTSFHQTFQTWVNFLVLRYNISTGNQLQYSKV